jgi:hypothetical protein
MELLAINNNHSVEDISFEEITIPPITSTDKPFIQANTIGVSFEEIRDKHIIPVFIKDNEPLISHTDFIGTVTEVAFDIYSQETILSPSIRVSHPIKGRIPEAKNKAANELLEHEKTLYYERMAFIIEVHTVYDDIDGNTLSLTIGGVKSFCEDNLYSKSGGEQHFKVFIGFQNKVCTNLCVWSDGLMKDLRVSSIGSLKACVRTMIENYNIGLHLNCMRKLSTQSITEAQFAHIIGRARLFNHLSKDLQNGITPLLFGDNQIGTVVKDYYKDESFCRDIKGNINLCKMYNLLTGVNKSSYIDSFLEKSASAYHFAEQLRFAIEGKAHNWFLN